MSIASYLRRRLIEPLWTIKGKNPMLGYWRELEKSQFYPYEFIKSQQWKKLKTLIRFAYNNNRYYHNRFKDIRIHPDEINELDSFRHLPIISKNDVRANLSEIISTDFSIPKLMEAKTGGSTGKALQLYFTHDCSEFRNACARRSDRWSGWEVGEPVAAVWGNPHYPKTLKEKVRSVLLHPVLYLDTMAITEKAVKEFAVRWADVSPTLLFGHAHSLFILAQYVSKYTLGGVAPKAIVSSSMMLIPHERAFIENTFGTRVFDRYGCEEVGLIASECEKHEGMHINSDNVLVEIIKEDGSPAAPGEMGYIVVTDLFNFAMPLIRYKIEDMGALLERPCSCDRGLPMMEKVAGRVADFLVKKDGTKIAGISLIENSLTKIPGIDQMQICQESLDLIVLRVVTGLNFEKSRILKELTAYFKDLFDDSTTIDTEFVEEIKREQSGKYRFSICKVHVESP